MSETGQQMPADWAINRVLELTGDFWPRLITAAHTVSVVFARYIEAHEQPPDSPVMAAARELVDTFWPEQDFGDGGEEKGLWMDYILTAIRRGMELEREQGQ